MACILWVKYTPETSTFINTLLSVNSSPNSVLYCVMGLYESD